MASYYKLSRKTDICSNEISHRSNSSKCIAKCSAGCSYVFIGIIYGDCKIIQDYYTKKGIAVQLELLSVIYKDSENKEASCSNLWKIHCYVGNPIYVVTNTREEVMKIYKLYCFTEAVALTESDNTPISQVDVAKCELVEGKPMITL
jgi:hypothetical protein